MLCGFAFWDMPSDMADIHVSIGKRTDTSMKAHILHCQEKGLSEYMRMMSLAENRHGHRYVRGPMLGPIPGHLSVLKSNNKNTGII